MTNCRTQYRGAAAPVAALASVHLARAQRCGGPLALVSAPALGSPGVEGQMAAVESPWCRRSALFGSARPTCVALGSWPPITRRTICPDAVLREVREALLWGASG